MAANIHDHLTDQLFKAILSLKDEEQCYKFFEDICTISELKAMAQRLASPQHDGQITLTFEVVYGHAFKPAPRVRVEANSTISLQDMRAMLRERT